jgi:ribonucleoside-diphosphate reductase beta chain
LAAFSNIETIHIAAYALLLETIGMPDSEFTAFLEYDEMAAKHDYMQKFTVDNPAEIARTIAMFGGFTEGLQLFASFAMLLNFPRQNKMKGMGQIVSWSVDCAKTVVDMEDKFIDLAFEMGPINGMTPTDIQSYIRYIADWRLGQLGLDPVYNIKEHPIPWLEEILNGVEHANFFEARSTEYSKNATTGEWYGDSGVWSHFDKTIAIKPDPLVS